MKTIKKTEQLKNVTKISTGTIIGQIILIASLPFISRLYGAEIIGVWTVITAYSNIVQYICDLGLTNVLMICEEEQRQHLFSVITNISLCLSVLSGVIIFVFFMLTGKEMNYAIMVCLLTVVYSFTMRDINLCYTILNRDKQYGILMKNPIIRFGSVAIISIILGLLGIQSGYYWGNIIGQVLTVMNMRRFLPKREKVMSLSQYKECILEYKNFVLYQMPSSVAVTLRTEIPNLLISSLFGNTMLGYFSISQKLLTIPVTFLGQALGKVFYQSIAEMRRVGKDISAFVDKNIRRGMLVALVPMTLLAAFGDVAVTIFFGLEYNVGGIICRIIVYRTLFNFISSATQGIDIVLDKQQYVLYTCLIQTVLAIGSVLVGYYLFDSIYVTSMLIVVTFIVVQIWYFCKIYQFIGLKPMRYIYNAIGSVAGMLVISLFLRYGVIAIIKLININILNWLLNYFVLMM